jgi:hypothetical protein
MASAKPVEFASLNVPWLRHEYFHARPSSGGYLVHRGEGRGPESPPAKTDRK